MTGYPGCNGLVTGYKVLWSRNLPGTCSLLTIYLVILYTLFYTVNLFLLVLDLLFSICIDELFYLVYQDPLRA